MYAFCHQGDLKRLPFRDEIEQQRINQMILYFSVCLLLRRKKEIETRGWAWFTSPSECLTWLSLLSDWRKWLLAYRSDACSASTRSVRYSPVVHLLTGFLTRLVNHGRIQSGCPFGFWATTVRQKPLGMSAESLPLQWNSRLSDASASPRWPKISTNVGGWPKKL